MPMHISPSISKDPGHIATMFPRISPIVNPLPPATQGDILDILQREQDRAVALLSSSPLLASLFVSYANQAAALDSATATPTSESDEWKALENTIATLQEEVDRLKPENVQMAESLGGAAAAQEAFRSQVSALKKANSTQLDDIKSLRAELFEAKRTHDQLSVDSDLERESLQTQISELEARQQELKETIVEQQVQMMKLLCKDSNGVSNFSNTPAMVETAGTHKFDGSEGKMDTEAPVKAITAKESAARAKRAAMEKVEREERKRERIEREERKRIEREGEKAGEAEEKADREAKEREEERKATASKTPSAWGAKNVDGSRKTSGLSQNEQKNERVNTKWSPGSTEAEDEPSGLPPIITSPAPGGVLDGAGKFDFFTKTDTPGGYEEDEFLTPLTKGKRDFDHPSDLSKVVTPVETTNAGKVDIGSISARVPISSENERFTDKVQGPPPPKPTPLTPDFVPSLSGAGDFPNPSGVRGDTVGSGGIAKTIAMPTLTGNGDRQSTFTDTACGQKREDRRENLFEGFLGSNPPRRRNDPPWPQMTTKPTPKPAQVPSPPAQKAGWGWGGSLLNSISSAATAPDRSPSPELAPVTWYTPGQPPKSQPAGFGPMKPASGHGTGGNNARGSRDGPTPLAQKPSTTWGNTTSSTFGSGIGKNLTVDTTTKPAESSPNIAGPEKLPEFAVEIGQVPAPGRFYGSTTDKKEEAGETQEGGTAKHSNPSSPFPAQEPVGKTTEQPAEESEEPTKAEGAATPADFEEDDFDWANVGKKKKKGRVAAISDPDNADDGPTGGVASKKKKKGKK